MSTTASLPFSPAKVPFTASLPLWVSVDLVNWSIVRVHDPFRGGACPLITVLNFPDRIVAGTAGAASTSDAPSAASNGSRRSFIRFLLGACFPDLYRLRDYLHLFKRLAAAALRAAHAVPSFRLRAVEGEIGLVDELVRVAGMGRKGGDADRERGRSRMVGSAPLEAAPLDSGANPLRDSERVVELRLGKDDGKLFAAEPGRDVERAELLR